MKQFLLFLSTLLSLKSFAQNQSTLYIKGGEKVIVTNVKKNSKETSFSYQDVSQKQAKTSLPNWLIDSIVIGKIDTTKIATTLTITAIDSNIQTNSIAIDSNTKTQIQQTIQPVANNTTQPQNTTTTEQAAIEKNHSFNYSLGLSLGNFMEFNNTSGIDKKSFSFTASLDLTYRYFKPNSFINMSHELHYIFGLQKESINNTSNLQRVQDDILTLHDLSFKVKKNSKWNINTIIKFSTSIFNIYDGDYFKDVNNLGLIKNFLSPYSLSVAPGIKYDASEALKLSISPYSFEMYGVSNNQIRAKGIYITDVDASGNFKKSIIKKQGFELNIWFDKRVKEWLEMQYRISVNSDYTNTNFGKNALLDGLFITKAKILKNLFLTHRATLYNNISGNLLKPFFTQTIQLSYSKSL